MSHLPLKGYLSLVEAAEYYSVSVSTMRRWIAQGLIPASRIGRTTMRIRVADLEAAVTTIPTARRSA